MKIRHTIENESTWEKLKAAVVAGTAGALIQPFNEIDLTLGNGEAVTVVAAAHLPCGGGQARRPALCVQRTAWRSRTR